MTLTQKHFMFIAELVKDYNYQVGADEVIDPTLLLDKLAATNPLFNRERFMKACGVE